MLKFIEPNSDYWWHRETIDSFLDLLRKHHGVSFSPELRERPAFLIASRESFSHLGTPTGKVYGGAILYPQKIPSELDLAETDTDEEKVIKLTSFFQPKGDEYWTARICLCLEQDGSAAAILETQYICHRFYKDIYKAFTEFGEKQGIDYLAYTLRIAETYNVKTYESWPYQLGVVLAEPGHAFAHGLLSLKGKAFEAKDFEARQCQKFGRPS